MQFSTKLITAIVFIGSLVYGATLVGGVAMPEFHQYCGAWG